MKKLIFLILTAFILNSLNAFSQKEAPAAIAAALTLKLAGFNKNLSGDVTIYVLGDATVASELKKGVGKPIGGGKLVKVETGDAIPSGKPAILYIGSVSKSQDAINYARSNKIMTITGIPSIVNQGASLGIGVGDDGKPKILLNLSGSAEEGIDWNPAIMKVAQTI